ncbi:MAG TPA: sigma-70 family RNA polymerase sigma factor [Acidimicrobiales bacterium]|jgi:RNA polymerase sigma-70 factor (ECF subfamily)|nr:sigma-70 family RNA polymerase sigma factor [Acidimicrobiales bacterium]
MALRQDEFTSLCDDVDLDRDRALVERCQAGDSAAFGNLYARYYERLLRFCQRRLSDRHEAEDAAQEAFARAWKALPNFAGERRFYPWLTVIAGNICTDMLRRRSRSTPTDDLELSSHQPVGASNNETSEELILAAVDGELVNRALDRLSVRHQHVLAMREGSGWTYQQIADHEGVEIGTIETLLWRARQALKREFNVLSEHKSALGGFLAGGGALLRRSVFRLAHRSAEVQQAGAGGSLRNAFAGVAVTSVAVAAAIITPQALSSSPHSTPAPYASSAIANPSLPFTAPTPPASTPTASSGDTSDSSDGSDPSPSVTALRTASSPTGIAISGENPTALVQPSGNFPGLNVNGPDSPLNNPVIAPVTKGLNQVTAGLQNTVTSLGAALGLAPILSQLGLPLLSAGTPNSSSTGTTTSTTLPPLVTQLTNTVASTLKSLLNDN